MDMATALSEIEAWPIDERVEFVQTVWDRIVDSGWQPILSDTQKAELDRRLAALEADPKNVVTWEEITDHVRRKR